MNIYAIVFIAMMSLVAMFVPQLSHSYIYFGVHVENGFRRTKKAKRILVRYQVYVLVWTAIALTVVLKPVHWLRGYR
jgi:uncharacterized membrane protein